MNTKKYDCNSAYFLLFCILSTWSASCSIGQGGYHMNQEKQGDTSFYSYHYKDNAKTVIVEGDNVTPEIREKIRAYLEEERQARTTQHQKRLDAHKQRLDELRRRSQQRRPMTKEERKAEQEERKAARQQRNAEERRTREERQQRSKKLAEEIQEALKK